VDRGLWTIFVQNACVRITAKADYAVRAALELASADGAVKGDALATAQAIPLKFLENILIDLRHSGIVRSQRGPDGGYWLAKPAADISVADVIRAVEGPLASVRGESPEELDYVGAAEQLQPVWVALRANIRGVLETVTLADITGGRLPKKVLRLTEEPGAWARR
jgi:Rrf2 family protein